MAQQGGQEQSARAAADHRDRIVGSAIRTLPLTGARPAPTPPQSRYNALVTHDQKTQLQALGFSTVGTGVAP